MHSAIDTIKPMILAAAIALGYLVHCTDVRATLPDETVFGAGEVRSATDVPA